MELIADYHVHSKFSRFLHGKDSIQDIVNAANALGLQEVAITDHGFRHLFGTNKQKLAKARALVDEINKSSPVKVMLGIEADIISEDGTMDVDNETISMIDILIAGYHRMIKTDFAGYFGSKDESHEAIQRNTNAYLNAIKKYPITIIAHLNYGVKVDVRQIANACADEDVCIEINNRHLYFSESDVQALIESDCMLVVDSDAHSRDEIAKVDLAFDFIKKHDFKSENFVNIKFDMSEMSEEHKELDAYYSIYQDKLNKKREVELYNEERRQNEFTNTLSDDLERQLKDIAEEKGYKYTSNVVEDDTFDINMDFGIDSEAEEIVEQAKRYIAEDRGNAPAGSGQEKSTEPAGAEEKAQKDEPLEAEAQAETEVETQGDEQGQAEESALTETEVEGTALAETENKAEGATMAENKAEGRAKRQPASEKRETAKATEKVEASSEKPEAKKTAKTVENASKEPAVKKTAKTMEKPQAEPLQAPKKVTIPDKKDDGFRFNLGIIDAKATKSTNKGTKIQKLDKNSQNSKPNSNKKNGKILV